MRTFIVMNVVISDRQPLLSYAVRAPDRGAALAAVRALPEAKGEAFRAEPARRGFRPAAPFVANVARI